MKTKSALLLGCTFLACMAISLNCKSQYLKYLWLNKSEVQDLIDNASNNRIFFQFYHNKSHTLTLFAWPENTGENDDNETKMLKMDPKGKVIYNLNDKNVLLATLNIGPKEIKKIEYAINAHKFNSIIFWPRIDKIDYSGIYHVYYDIYGSNKVPAEIRNTIFLKTLLYYSNVSYIYYITTTKNPSPPRQAN
jgi:hypothetical protein